MEKNKTMSRVKKSKHSQMLVYPQPLHPQLKRTTINKIREYFKERPNAHWMTASVGETEYYFVEKINEKEVKVPVIETITKYVIKEIPKEIKVEVTKEIEKIIYKNHFQIKKPPGCIHGYYLFGCLL
jgi:uncharacterized FlaG/YvyC family protein